MAKGPLKKAAKKAPPRLDGAQLALLKNQFQQHSRRGSLDERAEAKAVLSVIHEVEQHRYEEVRRAVLQKGAEDFASKLPRGL